MTTQTVSVWMTPNPVTVTPETTLPEAHRLMKERRIRRLPVMDGDKLVGIVTWGDIREASPSDATSLDIYELHTLLAKLSVREIMTRSPITVRPTTSIAQAAQLMLEHKIGGLPVVNRHGRLIGIITESDIFRVLVLGTAA
jgi:acetoin utilization protein AcuB